jgi:hypothetical protein
VSDMVQNNHRRIPPSPGLSCHEETSKHSGDDCCYESNVKEIAGLLYNLPSIERNLQIGFFPSSPAPLWWSLLKKGINPLRRILQKHIARHDFAGDVIGCPERTIDLAIERLLAQTDCGRAP